MRIPVVSCGEPATHPAAFANGSGQRESGMTVERRFSNLFPKGEDAQAFETAVRGAALEAGLSVGPGGVTDQGRPGLAVLTVLTGSAAEIDRFAAELHDGTRLEPLD